MKTKTPASTKKQSVTVKDLKTRKDPKGGSSGGKRKALLIGAVLGSAAARGP
ncbi:MAG: hypothetical protein Q7S40_33515 [Opitutaceae bacterium]|nr:hypothetical protein [Opitutaceae bacterium]